MAQFVIAVFSRDPLLVSHLRSRLQGVGAVTICEELSDLQNCVTEPATCAVVADFRGLSDGGHFHERALESIQRVRPTLNRLLLTDIECPEPLERRAACDGLRHLRGAVDWDALDAWVHQTVASAVKRESVDWPAGKQFRRVPSENASCSTVLDGITRRFETETLKLSKMLSDLEIAAQHDVTMLLIGETGSGKTFLSRLIHEVSPRRDEPFLPVACGALPDDLIESELFGHVKGAFTSAHADKDGKFLAAGRGTILLDEIDVLGPEQQVKLLRVIETGEFEPVGSNQTLKSQARIVVASNLDLEPLVEQGKFRPDLYYRLNMLKFEIPPLRERRPDIAQLARKFVEELSIKHGVAIHDVEPAVFDALLRYPWPGNVRELENVVRRAVIFCRDGVLRVSHLPSHIVAGVAGPTNDPSVKLTSPSASDQKPLSRQVAMTERELIEQALFKNNQSRTNAARDLGISRVTLYNKMKKYGMTKAAN